MSNPVGDGVPDVPISAKFKQYYELLIDWNQKINLTAITDERGVETLHFRDSLAVAEWIVRTPSAALHAAPPSEREAKSRRSEDGGGASGTPPPTTLIDVGSGAGFPGLPIAIALPEVRVTLLDATQKRVEFLQTVAAELELTNVKCVCGRAEDLCRGEVSSPALKKETGSPALKQEVSSPAANQIVSRETFSVATARAVSRLNELCELCLPLVAVGGAFVAMKSVDTDEEIAEAANAIAVLGGELEEVQDYAIEGTDVRHRLVVIRKVAPTPGKYPRRYAKIQKQPL